MKYTGLTPTTYISRLGNGWTVRVPQGEPGSNHYRRTLDKDYGSKEDAFKAAQELRDQLICEHNIRPRVRRKRSDAKNDLIPGLSETIKYNKNKDIMEKIIIATHPLKRKSRTFHYHDNPRRANQRTRKQAIELATRTRKEWERESGLQGW